MWNVSWFYEKAHNIANFVGYAVILILYYAKTVYSLTIYIKGAVRQAIQVPKPYKCNNHLMLFYVITEQLWFWK